VWARNGVSFNQMPAQADIIVSSPDSTEVKLVVEAKLKPRDLRETERQLKNFMLQLRCPLGLVVSPERLWVYFEFNIEGLIKFHLPSTGGGVAFENAVQAWLEDLSNDTARSQVHDPKLREIVNHYILPAIETGIVRAAGPR